MTRSADTQGRLGVTGPWEGEEPSAGAILSLRQDSSLWGQEECIQRGRGEPTHSHLAERSLLCKEVLPHTLWDGPLT